MAEGYDSPATFADAPPRVGQPGAPDDRRRCDAVTGLVIWSGRISLRARGPRPSARADASEACHATQRLCLAVLVTLVAVLSRPAPCLGARVDPGPDETGRPRCGPASPRTRRHRQGRTADERPRCVPRLDRRSHAGDMDHHERLGGPATRDFPTWAASRARERGATPLIWWQPVDPNDLSSPTYARHANIIAGRHDDYIRRFARAARDFGGPVILRFAHEANGNHFPWGVNGFDNTAASFVGAWRQVHRLFREVGATNVRFLWSVAKKACPGGCNPYTAFYPGDAYVDYMGFSNFNWGAEHDKWCRWSRDSGGSRTSCRRSPASRSSRSRTRATRRAATRRPGSGTAIAAVYEELPRIARIVYLDVDLRAVGHPDWRLGSPAAALAAYARIAALPQFQGRLPGT